MIFAGLRAGPLRQRYDCLLSFAFDPSSSRRDAGLLAAASGGIFRQRGLSDLAVQLCLSSR